MKYLLQITMILGITFVGEVLSYALPFPIHASIYGMLLLFALLMLGWLKLDQVEETGLFLIAIMPLFFVPPSVGLLDVWNDLAAELLPTAILFVLPTIVVFVVTGMVAQFVLRREEG